MNTERMKGNFKQMTGEIKLKRGQITDDDITRAEGSVEKLIDKIQQRTGERRRSIEDWLKQYV